MATAKSTLSQKEKLLSQLKEIESKLKNIDKQRSDKIGKLAKKHKIVDLSDSVIEKEFIEIRKKYDSELSAKDDSVKKSQEESVA